MQLNPFNDMFQRHKKGGEGGMLIRTKLNVSIVFRIGSFEQTNRHTIKVTHVEDSAPEGRTEKYTEPKE